MKKFTQELKDYKQLMLLLCLGKGSLSDYLIVLTELSIGLLAGYIMWG